MQNSSDDNFKNSKALVLNSPAKFLPYLKKIFRPPTLATGSNLNLMLQQGDDNVYFKYSQEASRNKLLKFSTSVGYLVCRELMEI